MKCNKIKANMYIYNPFMLCLKQIQRENQSMDRFGKHCKYLLHQTVLICNMLPYAFDLSFISFTAI